MERIEEHIGKNVWIRTAERFYHADIISADEDTVTIDCGETVVLKRSEIEDILTNKDASGNCARDNFFHIDLIPS